VPLRIGQLGHIISPKGQYCAPNKHFNGTYK
jgi:hypothetical protein